MLSFKLTSMGDQSLCISQEGSFCRLGRLRTSPGTHMAPRIEEQKRITFFSHQNLSPPYLKQCRKHSTYPQGIIQCTLIFLVLGLYSFRKCLRRQALQTREAFTLPNPEPKKKHRLCVSRTFYLFHLRSQPSVGVCLSGFPTSSKPWRKKELVNTNTGN